MLESINFEWALKPHKKVHECTKVDAKWHFDTYILSSFTQRPRALFGAIVQIQQSGQTLGKATGCYTNGRAITVKKLPLVIWIVVSTRPSGRPFRMS
jgi:hypothetical protein